MAQGSASGCTAGSNEATGAEGGRGARAFRILKIVNAPMAAAIAAIAAMSAQSGNRFAVGVISSASFVADCGVADCGVADWGVAVGEGISLGLDVGAVGSTTGCGAVLDGEGAVVGRESDSSDVSDVSAGMAGTAGSGNDPPPPA